MKTQRIKLLAIFIFALSSIIITSCKSTYHIKTKTPPPGQMKKITNSKSAKAFAPGQLKKKKIK